jgi:hypothetical protein
MGISFTKPLTILYIIGISAKDSQNQRPTSQFFQEICSILKTKIDYDLHSRLKQNPIASSDSPNENYADPSNRFKITPDGVLFHGLQLWLCLYIRFSVCVLIMLLGS